MDDDRVLAEALNECLDSLKARNTSIQETLSPEMEAGIASLQETLSPEMEADIASIQDCLARHPQQAARLDDLLQLSLQVKAMPLPAPTPQMLAAGERRLVQAIQARSRGLHTASPQDRSRVRSRASASQTAGPEARSRGIHTALPLPGRANLWAPLAAFAGVVLVLFVVMALVVVGGGRAYRAWRASRAAPVSPVAVLAPSAAPGSSGATLATLTSQAAPQARSPQPAAAIPAPTAALPGDAVPTEGAAAGAVAAATPAHASFLPLASRPIPPAQAMLQDLRGLVQVQNANGAWSTASEAQLLDAGRRIRTGALSAADVVFYDGSAAHLGTNTEISLDRLGQDAQDLSRIVVLTQSVGQTDHSVIPAPGPNGQYTVYTPSGAGTARGTVFHVSVGPAQAASVSVDQGAVAVTNLQVTVLVVAGQQTALRADAPPSEPVFRVTGEGVVEATGAAWRIAGQAFQTDANTVIVGDPQIGDWVHVEGRLLPNGDRMADRIVLLHRAEARRFTITGEVQARGETAWTVAGRTIAINDATTIDDPIAVGDWVRVRGIILDDKTLLAQSIVRLEPEGWPFSFVGVVEEISDAAWVVSGISVTVDAGTSLSPGLAVGDVVQVRGVRTRPHSGEGESSWLARSITLYQPLEQSFEFVGLVEHMDPWVVSGVDLTTDAWTEIEQGIAVGDRVKVEGRILPDGAWLAEEIVLLDEREGLPFRFSGRVESVDPWVVSGISLTVDGRTRIKGPIAVGDTVRVKGLILPSGAWLATEIKRIDDLLGLGCMQFTSQVIERHGNQVTLQNGVALHIGGVPTQGQVREQSVIQVYLCVDKQGHITIISIVVLYQPELEPTPTATLTPTLTLTPKLTLAPTSSLAPTLSLTPTPELAPTRVPEGHPDRVVICHKEGKHRKTMTVPWEAWINGHQQHGDTLGPCD